MKRESKWATREHLLVFILVLVSSLVATPWPRAQTFGSINKEKVLHTFGKGKDGAYVGSLISNGAGTFYGTASGGGRYGGGMVFQLTLGTNGRWAETILHSFKNGTGPGGLVLDAVGNLYGVTGGGGARGAGTAFKLSPGTDGKWTETVLYSFGQDGIFPHSSLIFDAAGNLYGTTPSGGVQSSSCLRYGCGTVFELMRGANGKWTEKVLHYFEHPIKQGSSPASSLTFDKAGNLYGTTNEGGSLSCGRYGCGTVFELTPNKDGTWTERLLHSFHDNGKDGYAPSSGLIFDKAGNLYGITGAGGTNASGTVFELTLEAGGRWTETVLHDFNGRDGAYPRELVFGGAGNLYGETYGGGSHSGCAGQIGCGTVFQLTIDANNRWSEKVLHNFCSASNCTDGSDPISLILDGEANLYGTTLHGGDLATCGGYGCGVAFELKP
jgi:uncharacterized repeat protein (TIGR03803 family)